MATQHNHLHGFATVRAASVLDLMFGTWLYISPWVFGYYATPEVWNSGALGGIIATMAALRIAEPSRKNWMSWLNCAIAIWVIASPWAYDYVANTPRFINSLCVGGAILIVGILSGSLTTTRHA